MNLEVLTSPGYGKPKVFLAKIRVDRSTLETTFKWKEILKLAADQAKSIIRQNIGTAVGEYSVQVKEDESLFDFGKYLLVTATWTSRCRCIKPQKPFLKPEDIFGE